MLEGAEDAFATASGMAAVNGALMSVLKAGDRVVSARALFGSCSYIVEEILTRFGVEIELVDGEDLSQWEKAVTPGTTAVFFESMSNPTLDIVDVAAVSALARKVGALTIVDNVFSTPVFSNAIEQGADLVVYSATKHIDGQGRALGGVILGSSELIRKKVETYMKHTGGAMSPFTAWIMLKGLETIDLRVRAQAASAETIAKALEGHKALTKVIYPGLASHPQNDLAMRQLGAGGTMLAFEIDGGKEATFRFMNALEVILISNNLGDAKSIATHPATTTHSRLTPEARASLNISDGLIRLSVGLEDADDLVEDLLAALDAV